MYIETKNLVKTFSGRNVVDGVSLRVDKGQVVGLLGPNGAGKTTSFYMIVGIERPSSGTVSYTHSEPTRQAEISYAVFCLKKKKRITKLGQVYRNDNVG